MRYITKCTKEHWSKVDHASESMTPLVIDNAATDSMIQLTVRTRNLSGGYKITSASHVHKLFFKNGRRSHQTKRSS